MAGIWRVEFSDFFGESSWWWWGRFLAGAQGGVGIRHRAQGPTPPMSVRRLGNHWEFALSDSQALSEIRLNCGWRCRGAATSTLTQPSPWQGEGFSGRAEDASRAGSAGGRKRSAAPDLIRARAVEQVHFFEQVERSEHAAAVDVRAQQAVGQGECAPDGGSQIEDVLNVGGVHAVDV